jgi:chaperonin GroES
MSDNATPSLADFLNRERDVETPEQTKELDIIDEGIRQYRAQKSHPNRINVYPLGSRIVVKPEAAETTTQTGLVIPDVSQEKPQRGRVLAVGPGREIVDRDGNVTVVRSKIQPGHTVLYSKYAGSIIVVDNPDYRPNNPSSLSNEEAPGTSPEVKPKLDLLVLSEADVLGIVLPPGQFDLGDGPQPAHE